LVEESRQKMLVRDFLMIKLRSEVLCCLKRLLHLLSELVDPHYLKITNGCVRAIARNSIAGPRLTAYVSLRWRLK
jgi:hypothetical protein